MKTIHRPTGNQYLDITKRNDMHFIYAFFFENGDDVHIKVGQSTTPYKRLSAIVNGSPFPVAQAVFSHCGSKSMAREFEEAVRRALGGRRTRGEWYVFARAEAPEFRAVMAATYAKTTGRQLKWSKIDLDAFTAQQAVASNRFHGRYLPPAA